MNTTPPTDTLLEQIAGYLTSPPPFSEEAVSTARLCLMDSLGCALLALEYPACSQLLGPVVPGATWADGARVPGAGFRLDPVQAAFNFGAMVRWLDFNDTWLAAEWGHPSDNLGAILTIADWQSRQARRAGRPPRTIADVLQAMIAAHEIQGVLALDNSFNRVGLDHVLLVRVASAAVAAQLLGSDRQQISTAVAHAWLDGGALRTYRQWPNTSSRKSWAAGDATSRGVRLALLSQAGAPACAAPLSADGWGFQDVLFRGQPIRLSRELQCYVMENVLFKVSYPAEFHGQTAVEAAIQLHSQVASRLDQIERIRIETQESAVRIIDKRGPLSSPADRDHCLQYMTAIGLLRGALTANDYEQQAAADPAVDRLREKMEVVEHAAYSRDYLDPGKRSIANAVQVFFADGARTERVEIEYPLGHRRRRDEARPRLHDKFVDNAGARLPAAQVDSLVQLFSDPERCDRTAVDELVDLTTPNDE